MLEQLLDKSGNTFEMGDSWKYVGHLSLRIVSIVYYQSVSTS